MQNKRERREKEKVIGKEELTISSVIPVMWQNAGINISVFSSCDILFNVTVTQLQDRATTQQKREKRRDKWKVRRKTKRGEKDSVRQRKAHHLISHARQVAKLRHEQFRLLMPARLLLVDPRHQQPRARRRALPLVVAPIVFAQRDGHALRVARAVCQLGAIWEGRFCVPKRENDLERKRGQRKKQKKNEATCQRPAKCKDRTKKKAPHNTEACS